MDSRLICSVVTEPSPRWFFFHGLLGKFGGSDCMGCQFGSMDHLFFQMCTFHCSRLNIVVVYGVSSQFFVGDGSVHQIIGMNESLITVGMETPFFQHFNISGHIDVDSLGLLLWVWKHGIGSVYRG